MDEYEVKRGDTLYSISKKFNISVPELIRINNLTSNTLSIGQILYLNDNSNNDNLEQNNNENNYNNYTDEYNQYVVKKGDSLWSISRKYEITVPELIRINNLLNTNLKIGDILLVPKTENDQFSNSYIVQSGDTLWSISKKVGLTVSELKNLNNLGNNLISVGQELIIK